MRLWAFLAIVLMSCAAVAEPVDTEKLRTIGADNSTLIYVFSSPSCPHCAAYHTDVLPALKKEVAEAGLAQIKLVEMPGDPRALKAAVLGRCMTDAQYAPYMTSVYKNQAYWLSGKDPDEMLRGYATLAGLDKAGQDRCLTNKKIADHLLQQGDNLANVYQIRALPTTVVVQGAQTNTFVGADPAILSQIIRLVRP